MYKQRKLLSVFLIIGILISAFLIYEHFSATASKFCSFGNNLDCGIVNKSPYANLDGISYLLTIDFNLPLPLIDISGINVFFDFITTNAFLGLLTLFFVLMLNLNYKKSKFLFVKREANAKWIKGIMVFSIVYGFYLFLIQHYILKTYCIFCLALDLTIIISLILSFKIKNG
ncbi:vitamin K epoxide reductase family protein [Candidatus Pacearchaeota archaeon]|nr:vitamin K epoxide reductase family protein [Candidatus Pacearchaeota archaeon]